MTLPQKNDGMRKKCNNRRILKWHNTVCELHMNTYTLAHAHVHVYKYMYVQKYTKHMFGESWLQSCLLLNDTRLRVICFQIYQHHWQEMHTLKKCLVPYSSPRWSWRIDHWQRSRNMDHIRHDSVHPGCRIRADNHHSYPRRHVPEIKTWSIAHLDIELEKVR